ncbi:MAG TPA: ABC transporter permease subunit [Clostridia bacterium]|nr:ABC transporter permease subunit [Clostridia bacterium]
MKHLRLDLKRNWDLYLMAIPMIAYYLIFHYGPMYGLQIAFLNYNPVRGFANSPFVGLKHFQRFLSMSISWQYIFNTLRLSLSSLIFSYPLPILLALMLNALPNKRYRKTLQTTLYLPHFVSVVIVVGILSLFSNSQVGVVNQLIRFLGGTPVNFDTANSFVSLYVLSGIWNSAGWSTIIYTGALTGISMELYEAAIVDGATKLQRIRHIELPALLPTVSITLIMAIGGIMSVGWEKVYLMQKPFNLSVSEIISTYTYKTGIINAQFSFSAAIGLFNSVINFVLLVFANTVSRKVSGTGFW